MYVIVNMLIIACYDYDYQAGRWQRGEGHKRTNLIYPSSADSVGGSSAAGFSSPQSIAPIKSIGDSNSVSADLSFMQKLERRKKARNNNNSPYTSNTQGKIYFFKCCILFLCLGHSDGSRNGSTGNTKSKENKTSIQQQQQQQQQAIRLNTAMNPQPSIPPPVVPSTQVQGRTSVSTRGSVSEAAPSSPVPQRQRTAIMAAQKRASDRLAALNQAEGGGGAAVAKEFRCVIYINTHYSMITLQTYE